MLKLEALHDSDDAGGAATSRIAGWRQWLDHPERSTLRNAILQVHLWIGAIASMYVLVMSISGSIVVFRNFAPASLWMARTVELHTKLMSGSSGEIVNGVGGIMVTVLCLTGAVIWWPGIAHWRRSLTVSWEAHHARIFWDLHSAVGFWCFPLLLIWACRLSTSRSLKSRTCSSRLTLRIALPTTDYFGYLSCILDGSHCSRKSRGAPPDLLRPFWASPVSSSAVVESCSRRHLTQIDILRQIGRILV